MKIDWNKKTDKYLIQNVRVGKRFIDYVQKELSLNFNNQPDYCYFKHYENLLNKSLNFARRNELNQAFSYYISAINVIRKSRIILNKKDYSLFISKTLTIKSYLLYKSNEPKKAIYQLQQAISNTYELEKFGIDSRLLELHRFQLKLNLGRIELSFDSSLLDNYLRQILLSIEKFIVEEKNNENLRVISEILGIEVYSYIGSNTIRQH